MHCLRLSFVVYIWSIFTKLGGAWVNPIQNAVEDRPAATSESVHEALVQSSIIPDVLDDFQPSVFITLSYASRHKSVNLGNKIKPKKVTSAPIFNIDASAIAATPTRRSNTTYTLVLSDPDAISRADPVMAQMCHWIVTNLTVPFQSSDSDGTLDWLPSLFSAKGSKETGITEVMPYLPPSPPPKTGYHRYVFVLLAPGTEEGIGIQKELTKPKDRPHWGYGKVGAGVREWADENDLVVVGANFFYSKNKKQ